ncbi:hypothetical protein [Rhodococcus kronopolitis]|uniref:Uncharacterized protein n=1 Tax=Rhodococcus kronopolitis TaxID=1460226 RepID=A0ABV9FK94_9NOCA
MGTPGGSTISGGFDGVVDAPAGGDGGGVVLDDGVVVVGVVEADDRLVDGCCDAGAGSVLVCAGTDGPDSVDGGGL